MTRRSRLVFWLALGLALLALHWFLGRNADFLSDARLDPVRVLRIVLFLAWIPLIVFAVRLVDLLAFDVVASRRKRVSAP
ncbi:MAG TPA: hypothetical protein VGF28_23985, partial [Thermoanaerobaculia bacterium]